LLWAKVENLAVSLFRHFVIAVISSFAQQQPKRGANDEMTAMTNDEMTNDEMTTSPPLQQKSAVGLHHADGDNFPTIAVKKVEAVHEASEVYFFAVDIAHEVFAGFRLAVVHTEGTSAVGAESGVNLDVVDCVGGVESHAFDVNLGGGEEALGEQDEEERHFFHGKKLCVVNCGTKENAAQRAEKCLNLGLARG